MLNWALRPSEISLVVTAPKSQMCIRDRLSALFVVGGVVIGLLDRMNEEELVETFVAGCADLLGVAFIIGISRGITVLMNDGAITDTILHWGEDALSGAGPISLSLIHI